MATKDTTKATVSSKVKKERIRIPRLSGNNPDQTLYVAVNGQTFLIQRGVYVEVPDYVAEAIENSELAEDVAYQYAESKALKQPKE